MSAKFRIIQFIFVSICSIVIGYQYFTDSDVVNADKLAATYTATAAPITAANTPVDHGKLRASIALQEYNKGVEESIKGCNCGPEIDKYTEGNAAQWCAMFASWVTLQSGSPMTDRVTKSWRIANSRVFEKNLIDNGTYFTKSDISEKKIEPKLGDYVIFARGGEDSGLGHIGIVVEYDARTNEIGMISGNFKDKIAYHRGYEYMEHNGFLGIGRPEK
ncbi:CHAP domain-containing protein [bacterium]|nr:MAG: CHAP domain-containing protein [bacterium]